MKDQKFGQLAHLFVKSQMACGITAFFLTIVAMSNPSAAADAILIDFSSEHCGPCRAMTPVIAQLERAGVPVRHVDVNTEPGMAARYGIRSTPTFVIVSGGKELTRLVGMQTMANLQRALSINPSGPLIQTGANLSRQPQSHESRTRLAPVPDTNLQLAAAPQPRESKPLPSLSVATAIQRAKDATVRLRVHDGHGYGAGTGTIIDTHGDEALVLTCGHLFRENKGQGRIEVDVFVNGKPKTVLGKVIDYDSDDRDIALVAIRPGIRVEPVEIIKKGSRMQTGQAAFSFGCDRGDPPTRRDTRITGIDKYNAHLGASNIEISGAPVDGRSGGGLFDAQGTLIGVCNAADYKGDVGIYTGPGSIQWQLDRVNLSRLYEPPTLANHSPRQLPNRRQQGSVANARIASYAENQSSRVVQANFNQANFDRPTRASSTRPAGSSDAAVGRNQEVIVIVRDPGNPDGTSKVMTLRDPSPELMNMIQRQSR